MPSRLFHGGQRRALHAGRRRRPGRGRRRRRGDADPDRARCRERAQPAAAGAADAAGWKRYEPKADVALEPGVSVHGTKRLEWLLRPERPGTTTIPALTLATFDPVAKHTSRRRASRSRSWSAASRPGAAIGPPVAAGTPAPGTENVITAEIRPIRVRAAARPFGHRDVCAQRRLQGDAGDAAADVPGARVRGAAARSVCRGTRARRRRRLRAIARRRLRAAEAHRDAGARGGAYVEIDRVLRDVLSEQLGTFRSAGCGWTRSPICWRRAGCRRADVAGVARLDACDEARFSPGGEPAGRPAQDAMLERAAALIDVVEKAPLAAGGQA